MNHERFRKLGLELIKNRGLPVPAPIVIQIMNLNVSDHRPANPESLAVIFRACENTSHTGDQT